MRILHSPLPARPVLRSVTIPSEATGPVRAEDYQAQSRPARSAKDAQKFTAALPSWNPHTLEATPSALSGVAAGLSVAASRSDAPRDPGGDLLSLFLLNNFDGRTPLLRGVTTTP